MANDGVKSLIGKILFVIGVIIVLIVLAFLIIKFVPKMFSGLANVGSSINGIFGGKEEIVVTSSDTDLSNGESFNVSWSLDTNKSGVYSITNSCVENVNIDIETPNGVRRLICDSPFTLGSENGSVNLIANLNKDNSFADVPVVVYFTENGSDTTSAEGSVIVTIQNGDPNAGTFGESKATISTEAVEQLDDDSKETSTPSATKTSAPKTVVQNSYATTPADLAISNVVAFGNQVSFTVSNNGGQRTGNWTFNYSTPTSPKETLSSPLQVSLSSGQSIRYTLTFGVKDSGNQNVVIQLDPSNSISEISETNNIGTISLAGGSIGGGNTGGNYDSNDDADFVIKNLEVGRLSGNSFREDDRADEGDDIALRFTVENRGGENTDSWRFEVDNLPYDDDDTYRSKSFPALRPGESIEITVEFENVDEGDYDIEVNVDSEDDTDEESESNNDDSVELEVRN